MSLFPKFRISTTSLATPATPATQTGESRESRESRNPPTLYREVVEATPPPAALEVFPDWQGLLVKSKVLEMTFWLVRNRQDGEALARETGHPGLLLDDVLRQKGQTREEARAALLPVLIVPLQ